MAPCRCGRPVACPCLPLLEFLVMLPIATVVLLLGAIAKPQVPRLDLPAVATGGQVTGHYKLTGGKQYYSETKRWSQDFQIVPADFTRSAPEHQ